MGPAQIHAVEYLETSARDGRQRTLIQMASGGSKTFTAIDCFGVMEAMKADRRQIAATAGRSRHAA